jgi:hypothetical protein
MRTAWNKGLKGGQVAWNKGKPWSEDARNKMSIAKLGRPSGRKGKPITWTVWNKGIKTGSRPLDVKLRISKSMKGVSTKWLTGIKQSEQSKLRKSLALKGVPKSAIHAKRISEGKKNAHFNHSLETRTKLKIRFSGAGSNNWKGGISLKNHRIRASMEMKDWRKAVYKRDNFTCVICGINRVPMQADHIKPFAYFPDLRFDIENGRTLCIPCHKKTETYGNRYIKIIKQSKCSA